MARGPTNGNTVSNKTLQLVGRKEKPGNTRTGAWGVRGVSPETQNAARIAARRAGKTLGEWVDETLRLAAMEQVRGPSVPAATQEDTMRALMASLERRDQMMADLAGKVDEISRRRGWLARLFRQS